MEVIGKFILNLIADSIASLIHDIFVALLTVIMDFVSKMIVSLWDDSVVSAIVSCSSWIAMGVFAVGCILMLYDILEARSEEKAVYMSAVTKNFVSGLAFALFGPKLVHVMTKAILSLIQLLKLSDSVTNFEGTEYANSLTNLWLSPDLVVGSSLLESVICFFIVVIGSGVFIYKITLRFVQFITLIAMVPLYETNIARNAQNYKALPDEQREPGGPKARFQDNISALRLLQHLETTGMQATPEQQQLLARYVGWGGLADAFDARKGNWHKEYQELKELLPEAEYEAARASTLTSYYTSPEIVRAMYSTLERFGLQGGNILEPSMGVGAFFANRPASFNESAHLFGVEIDPVTGRIAKQLYPKANIQICGYEKATLPDSYFDVVIGNVPFLSLIHI